MLIKRRAEKKESDRAEGICTEYLMEGALTVDGAVVGVSWE